MKVTKTVSDIKLLWGETTPTGPVTGRLPSNIRRAEMPGLTGCWSLASIFVKIQYWLGSFIRINKGGFRTTYPALNVSKRKTLILWVERVCVSWKQAGSWPHRRGVCLPFYFEMPRGGTNGNEIIHSDNKAEVDPVFFSSFSMLLFRLISFVSRVHLFPSTITCSSCPPCRHSFITAH